MTLALGEHQDIARAIALLGDHNIGEAAAKLGAAFHLLRLDMVTHLATSRQPSPIPLRGARTPR